MLPLLACPFFSACCPFAVLTVCLARSETCLQNQSFRKELRHPQALPFLTPAHHSPFPCQRGCFLSTTWHTELEWAHVCRSSSSSFVSSEKPKCQGSSAWVCWTTCDLLSPCREPDGHLEHEFLFYSYCITLKASQISQTVSALTFHINNCCS